jgi:MYXO-CTERM domain-containing protein
MTKKALGLMAMAGAGAAAILWLVLIPRSTNAYTISTILSPGCHEKLTSEALRAVRLDTPMAAPLPPTGDEQALVNDVQFTLDEDMRDLGGATLLLSVRDNDLKGRGSDDLTQLAEVHGNPDNQDEHCLRNQAQDEPGGSEAALVDCRTFIRGRVVEALEGLDASGRPDPAQRTELTVHLSLRGTIDASLPTYYVRIGQAIHGVEDSFSHTYRTPDGMKVTTVLNWIDVADGNYLDSRDGPAHASGLDACDDPDELRTTKRQLATTASIALLRATLDPTRTKAEKMTTVDAILDTYLGYSPGCTYDNRWCNAAESQYKDKASTFFGCSTGGDGAVGAIGALLALGLASRRRRTVKPGLAVLLIAGVVTLTAASARAAEPGEPPVAPAATDKHEAPPPTTVPVPQPGPTDPSEAAWGAYLGISGSVDKPSFAFQLGLRRRMSTHWTLGLDAEWNPWVSWTGPTPIRAGALNAYGTVILRFPLAYENFNLRTTANLGISWLLIDLYGAPKGSVGLYAAIYPLGLEWKLSRVFILIINPLGIALPVPQLQGVPMTYPQYRISIGLGILGN